MDRTVDVWYFYGFHSIKFPYLGQVGSVNSCQYDALGAMVKGHSSRQGNEGQQDVSWEDRIRFDYVSCNWVDRDHPLVY